MRLFVVTSTLCLGLSLALALPAVPKTSTVLRLRPRTSDESDGFVVTAAVGPQAPPKAATRNPLSPGIGPPPPTQSEVTSALLLITGTTVGAGILALPAVTAPAGFLPSSAALILTWIFMASSGLLIAEVVSNLVKRDESSKGLGYLSMISLTLPSLSVPSGAVYALLHYALLVAYIAGGGDIAARALSLPPQAGPVLFTASLGSLLAFGSPSQIDSTNNIFVACVGVSFAVLLSLIAPLVGLDFSGLQGGDFSATFRAVPVMLVALVFHNVVPTVCAQLKYNRPAITKAVVLGSALPLAMFLLWNAAILAAAGSSTAVSAAAAATASTGTLDPLLLLRAQPGAAGWIDLFSLSAIITSFTGFVFGLLSFYRDVSAARAAKSSAKTKTNTDAQVSTSPSPTRSPLQVYALVLIPPTLVALAAPDIFLPAVDFAGAYGITLLFGVLPVVMAFLSRDANTKTNTDVIARRYERYLPGGAGALSVMLVSACGVIVYKAFFSG